jgi:uncharacterized protein (TIGR02246 family)
MHKFVAVSFLLLTLVPPVAAADLKSDLMAREKAFWTAWGKKDGAAFKTGLTADAVEVVAGYGPIAGRDAIAKSISALPCELRSFDFKDPTLRRLSSTVVILSYTATQDATCDGKKMPPKLHAMSVYVKQSGKWKNANYQETPID